MDEHWVSISEVAARLKAARATVKKRLLDGSIPGRTTHLGILRVRREVFEKWAKTHEP